MENGRPWTIPKLSTILSIRAVTVYDTYMRNLQITESEETVLVQMACFFNDCGIPDDFDQDSYDSLFDKITEPTPFEYS